jgi:S-adenosyl methyltransferase
MNPRTHTPGHPPAPPPASQAPGTGRRQPSRDHLDDHYLRAARTSIVLTCDDAGPGSILSEIAGVFHFITDEQDPATPVAWLRDQLPAGSHLVLSHAT